MKKEQNYSVLQVCVDLDGGGIDRYLYNYCTRISGIHFDFAAIDNKNGILEEPLKRRGFNIYKVPRISNGIKQNYLTIKSIMKQRHYDAVHVHLGFFGFLALMAAKRSGIKTRIAHAHIAFVPESIKDKIIRKVLTLFTRFYATNLAACGIDAAKWVWGKTLYEKGKVIIHNNAIDTHLYEFDIEARAISRKEFNIQDNTLLVGHVGRLCEQKNQKRLIEIFSEIVKRVPNSRLLLIGFVETGYDIDSLITKNNLQNKVIIAGVRDDVPKLLNAIDVFIFPSKFEGLPFTLIETQCNGLYAICSSATSSYVKVSSCVDFLSLSDENAIWADRAILKATGRHHIDVVKDVINAGYDLDTEAKKLKEYYIKLITTNA